MKAEELLLDLRRRGVELRAEGEKLRISAPKGLLTAELQEQLRGQKPALLELLLGPRPVSFAQERLCFLDRLIREPIYNLGGALRLRGRLELGALEQALRELLGRHEVLRTTFGESDGRPWQRVGPVPEKVLEIEDLEGGEAAVPAVLAREALVPFELGRGPLLRLRLLVLAREPAGSPRDAVLLATMHHIVSDAWSVGIFEKELAALYAAFRDRLPSPLAPLPWQYADFATWQRQLEERGELAVQLRYWEEQLADLEPLRLPADRPRQARPSFQAGLLRLDFGPDRSAAIAACARRHAATPFMVLLAGLAVTVAVYSGRRDVAIGSPIANRHRRELENLIGFFVNTQALRLALGDRPSFRQLLERTRQVCLEAHAHQDLPFEHLVERLRPEREAGENPFFPVIFAFQNVPRGRTALAGLEIEPLDFESGRLRLDLELYLSDGGEGSPHYSGHALYAEELFERATVANLVASWQYGLDLFLAAPEASVFARPLLSPEQESLLLGAFSGGRRAFEAEETIYRRFLRIAAAHPEAVAVEQPGGAGETSRLLTYGELAGRAAGLARRLRQEGLAAEEPVALLFERSAEMIVALLGVLGAGGVYLALEKEAPRERRRSLVRDAGAARLLSHAACLAEAGELAAAEGLALIEVAADPAGEPGGETAPPPGLGIDSLAYIAYTSGSTGQPKGAAIPQRGVLRLIDRPVFFDEPAAAAPAGILAGDVFLQLAPVAFDASTLEIWGALLHGARLVTAPPGPLSLDHLAALLERHRVSVLWLTAGLFHQLADHKPQVLRGLRRLLAGGDVLSPERCRSLLDPSLAAADFRLIDGYGPTENTTFTCCHVMAPGADPRPAVPVGRPIDDTEIYVLDGDGRLVPPGVAGELFTGGGGLARGYLGQPAATAAAFLPHPFAREPGARLYRSGDRVRFRPDGRLEFLGRSDFQVKVRGFRVEPGELAAALELCPGVRRAAVAARRTAAPEGGPGAAGQAGGDVRLDAYLVLDPARAAELMAGEAPVETWRELYDDTYAGAGGELDFEIVGWQSSYTGAPLPAAEMAEWVEATVARISALQPRRILEIGCGTGLLLARLAPAAERYVATDFSPVALAHIAALVDQRGLRGVETVEATAERVGELFAPGSFDTVLLNSVTQYFPSAAYLVQVLEGALSLLAPGGSLFVGDVRLLPRQRAFHSSLQMHRASGEQPLREVLDAAERALASERELVIDPELFRALARRDRRIEWALLQPKRGAFENELTRFRFDATLRRAGGASVPVAALPARRLGARPLEELERLFGGAADRPRRPLRIEGLADARVAREFRFLARADAWRRRPKAKFAELEAELAGAADGAVDPEALGALAARLGLAYQPFLDPADPALFGALLWPEEWPAEEGNHGAEASALVAAADRAERREEEPPWASWVQQPISPAAEALLLAGVRQRLRETLPAYLQPDTFTVLAELPLNANGKVDQRALPAPLFAAEKKALARPPASATERRLAAIWAEVLRPAGGLSPDLDDDFFESGGHSLQATRMVARIRETFAVDLPLRRVFETSGLGALAAAIDEELASAQPFAAAIESSDLREGPLALAQRRIWVLHRLEGGSAYHVPLAARLRGELDGAALAQALAAIVRRHAILRTSFGELEGEPVQRIAETSFELAGERLAGEEELAGRLRREIGLPFDLARPPLLRARLFVLGERHHVLLVVFHHLVADGWSLGIFLNELAELYDAIREGRPASLPELPLSYLDFARWQQSSLAPQLEKQLTYWRRKLAGAPQTLALATDRPRPPRQLFRGAAVPFRLERAAVEGLRAWAQKAGASLYMALLALFGALLALRSGRRDLLIGSPIAGRTRREVEPLIGLFVNTLVLRIEADGDPSFEEFLGRVRATVLEAFENQDLPFEKLVEALRPERDLSRNPLVQAILTLHNDPRGEARLGAVAIEPLEADGGTVKVDLDLAFWPRAEAGGEALEAVLRYDRDLFEEGSARRWVDHFLLLADQVLAGPGKPFSSLPRATAAERRILEGPRAAARRPAAGGIPRFLAAGRALAPPGGAITDGARVLSWAELADLASAYARGLGRHGVRRGDLVAVLVDRSVHLPALLLGIWQAGAAWVPLDPIFPPERRTFVCEAAGPVLVIADGVAAAPAAFPALEPAALLRLGESPAAGPGPAWGAELDGEELAYVIFTSGSTGRPKGVAISHGAVVAFLAAFARRPGLGPGDTLLALTTLSFDIAVLELFLPFLVGAGLFVASRAEAADPALLARRIADSGATVVQATPTSWRLLDASGWTPPASLRIFCGGEALVPELARRLSRAGELWNVYGPTEATVWATAARLAADEIAEGPLPVGRPIPGTWAEVVDPDGMPVGFGVDGELLLGGAGLARGYFGRPALTAERFVPDPHGGGGRLYRTGDLARWRPDGQLSILGRLDHQIKLRGFRIELGEIEAALAAAPAVAQAAVVFEAGDEARLLAFVVPRRGAAAGREELLDGLRRRLPAYMIPAEIFIREELPTTANGKIDRRLLLAGSRPLAPSRAAAPPETPRQAALLELWREALRREPGSLGIDDDFFEAGGHSLAAIRLLAAIESRLGERLPLASLFEASTVRRLARRLEGAPGLAGGAAALLPLARGGSASPLFMVPGVAGNPVYLRLLAEKLGRPCFGLEAQGADGRAAPQDRVEAMAARHLAAIARLSPPGKWLLAGHSFGAKIAFETARQAIAAGYPVAALVVFDTPAPTAANRPLGAGWDEFDWLAEAAQQIAAWRGQAFEVAAAELRQLGEAAYPLLGERLGEAWVAGIGGAERLRGMARVSLASQRFAYVAAAPLELPIHLFVAARRPRVEDEALAALLAEPDLGWGRLTSRGAEVRRVPGDHIGIFAEPAVTELAGILREVLEDY